MHPTNVADELNVVGLVTCVSLSGVKLLRVGQIHLMAFRTVSNASTPWWWVFDALGHCGSAASADLGVRPAQLHKRKGAADKP
jgi:hypothetical protein